MQQGGRLKKCAICGTLISNVTNPVCKACLDYDDELFESVQHKLKYGERITIDELAERSGVSKVHIERWVSLGRLGSVGNSNS